MSRLTINSNIASLNAQRRLGSASNDLSVSFNRLSSGLRINRASDDAAGLAVSSLLQADARIYNQGIRNLNDGVSYLNVAEGAITELSNIVVRIRELAEQGANGTIGDSQRKALQEEVNALQSEYNRIIRSTEFNNNTLLTGLGTNTILQGGFGERGSLEIQVGKSSLGIESDPTRAGEIIRIDTDSNGNIGNGSSDAGRESGISADGRYVVFDSNSTNLIEGGSNGNNHVYVKDMFTNETIFVSSSIDGSQGNGYSNSAKISSDGRYVTFQSTSTNLVLNDTNGVRDVFRKDLQTGDIVRVHNGINGNEANGISTTGSISADGRYITFSSEATNLVEDDTNGAIDVFMKDMVAGDTRLISVNSNGNQSNGTSSSDSISSDGRFVFFQSLGNNLVDVDTNGTWDAFLRDTLNEETILISESTNGLQGNQSNISRGMSVDGRFLAIDSSSDNLVDDDTNGVIDGFLKDRITGELIRVTTDSEGNQGNAHTEIKAISADGRFILFDSTANNLVDGDTNGMKDVFVKDMQKGETRRVSMDNEGGQLLNSSVARSISADGRFAVFNDTVSGGLYLSDLSEIGLQEIAGMFVFSQASARVTLDLAKRYEEELGLYQAGIGAGLSRASTFISSLQTASENFQAASSQITDVDVADESSRLVRNQILQQSAAGVLAQANLQPQLVLQLLEGI